jgi:hypothetical protein
MDELDLREEAELIDVTSALPYPDERWRFTDAAGHEHRYRRQGAGDYYPTLVWVVDERWWCDDCGDEHTEGHYECRACGERIVPGLAGPDYFPRRIPGRVTYWLGDTEISPDRYRELRAQQVR